MRILQDYPGTLQHQALLRAIASYYAHDPRVLAVSLFGSLGRGTWDRYSDLDLDVVVIDDTQIAIRQELTSLCDSLAVIDERAALIVPDGAESGDVVLESLMEFSIRYHPLHTTSPNIVDSLQILAGRIDLDTIKAAGLANRQIGDAQQMSHILNKCIRYVVGVDVALQRHGVWGAIELLHRCRELLMELFARTRNEARSYQAFQVMAEPSLQTRLGATLPQYDLHSAQVSLARLVDILENDLGQLSNDQVELGDGHRAVLSRVRMRQAQLVFEGNL